MVGSRLFNNKLHYLCSCNIKICSCNIKSHWCICLFLNFFSFLLIKDISYLVGLTLGWRRRPGEDLFEQSSVQSKVQAVLFRGQRLTIKDFQSFKILLQNFFYRTTKVTLFHLSHYRSQFITQFFPLHLVLPSALGFIKSDFLVKHLIYSSFFPSVIPALSCLLCYWTLDRDTACWLCDVWYVIKKKKKKNQ